MTAASSPIAAAAAVHACTHRSRRLRTRCTRFRRALSEIPRVCARRRGCRSSRAAPRRSNPARSRGFRRTARPDTARSTREMPHLRGLRLLAARAARTPGTFVHRHRRGPPAPFEQHEPRDTARVHAHVDDLHLAGEFERQPVERLIGALFRRPGAMPVEELLECEAQTLIFRCRAVRIRTKP